MPVQRLKVAILLLDLACSGPVNPFRGNFNHWQDSRKEAGQIFLKRQRECGKGEIYYFYNCISIVCLTRDFIRQGHAREKRKVYRAARRSIEGYGRGEAVTSRRYGNCLTASKLGACTAQPVRAARRLRAAYGTRNRITSQA